MRIATGLLLTLLAAQPALAQWPQDPRAVPPLPPIGLPLPQIGLPHPPTGLPAPGDSGVAGDHKRAPRPRPRGRQPVVPIFVVPYVIAPPAQAEEPARSTPARPGSLRLKTSPRVAGQVYLDGSYIGPADGSWQDLDVEAGVHTIEVRAQGYEPLVDSLLVTAGHEVTYTAALRPTLPPERPAAQDTPVTRKPTTLYVIPGCYAGNVPPEQAGLGPGCDPRSVVIVTK